jgi:hypothetical protein
MYFEFINHIIDFSLGQLRGNYRLHKYKMISPLMVGLIMSMIIVTVFSAGILQNNTSQKNDIATYTGFLVGGGTFSYPIRSLDHPYSVTSDVFSFVFADGRQFIADKTLAESKNVTFKATYLVYYNVTEPSIAIDIVKIT